MGASCARAMFGRVLGVVVAVMAVGGRGALAYTHARDVGLLATATPPTTSALGTVGGVDVYGLNFAPGTSSAASVPGQLKCIFGGSPGEGYNATTVAGTTAVRCDTPSGREGFVALGLSSNGGVDAILFHELGMSSVVNFVREYKGTLTRSSPHVASQGDVARLTGRTRFRRMDAWTSSEANARASGEARREEGLKYRTLAWACTCRARS